jgi:hypothetical protein
VSPKMIGLTCLVTPQHGTARAPEFSSSHTISLRIRMIEISAKSRVTLRMTEYKVYMCQFPSPHNYYHLLLALLSLFRYNLHPIPSQPFHREPITLPPAVAIVLVAHTAVTLLQASCPSKLNKQFQLHRGFWNPSIYHTIPTFY